MPTHEKSPYAAGTGPDPVRLGRPRVVDPEPSVHVRAEGFIRILAGQCKGCMRSGSTDCARRCPASGATAIVRSYDLARLPPLATYPLTNKNAVKPTREA